VLFQKTLHWAWSVAAFGLAILVDDVDGEASSIDLGRMANLK
jgi:hypothetical protein